MTIIFIYSISVVLSWWLIRKGISYNDRFCAIRDLPFILLIATVFLPIFNFPISLILFASSLPDDNNLKIIEKLFFIKEEEEDNNY